MKAPTIGKVFYLGEKAPGINMKTEIIVMSFKNYDISNAINGIEDEAMCEVSDSSSDRKEYEIMKGSFDSEEQLYDFMMKKNYSSITLCNTFSKFRSLKLRCVLYMGYST